MITEEQFAEVVAKVTAGEGLNNEEATLLIQALAELDQRGLIAENVVQFVLTSADVVYNEVADSVIKAMSLRDLDKVKKVRSIGTKAAAQLTSIAQMYVAQLYMQMQQAEKEEGNGEEA